MVAVANGESYRGKEGRRRGRCLHGQGHWKGALLLVVVVVLLLLVVLMPLLLTPPPQFMFGGYGGDRGAYQDAEGKPTAFPDGSSSPPLPKLHRAKQPLKEPQEEQEEEEEELTRSFSEAVAEDGAEARTVTLPPAELGSRLQNGMAALYRSRKYADCELLLGSGSGGKENGKGGRGEDSEKALPAHRLVLTAWSSVFGAALERWQGGEEQTAQVSVQPLFACGCSLRTGPCCQSCY